MLDRDSNSWFLSLEPANQKYSGTLNYTISKLCNVLCAYEMNRRLAALGINHVAVNAFDPGLMPGTGLARDVNFFLRTIFNIIVPILRYIVPNTNLPSTSGLNLGSLAISEKYEGVTGKYFEGQKEIKSSDDSYDENRAQELWTESVKFSNVTSDEALFN
ncbi:hypothetical protein HW132_35785 [Brasilonema sp. CT11]|nr:hypothetical protein [Brasilonema sp. CT11]